MLRTCHMLPDFSTISIGRERIGGLEIKVLISMRSLLYLVKYYYYQHKTAYLWSMSWFYEEEEREGGEHDTCHSMSVSVSRHLIVDILQIYGFSTHCLCLLFTNLWLFSRFTGPKTLHFSSHSKYLYIWIRFWGTMHWNILNWGKILNFPATSKQFLVSI